MDQRKVALVCHSPASQLNSRQKGLFEALAGKCRADKLPFFVHVWVNKDSGLTKDRSQRIRSFLYASLAGVIASILKLDRIRFYENGPISLNLPICEALVGATATRTTHPKTVRGMTKLLSLLLGTDFVVENPFLWKTRTDVVAEIRAADAADLIPYTVSCSHTQGMTRGQLHCGRCSQGIDRRLAVLAAACQQYDPADSYEVDVLTGDRERTEDRTMLERYLGLATRVSEIEDAVSFVTEFPEAYRAVNGLTGDKHELAEAVFCLCKPQAEQINSVVDRSLAVAAKAGELRRGDLPDNCALMLVRGIRRFAQTEERGTANGQRAPAGEWVGPMTKAEMARRVLNISSARWRKASSLFTDEQLQQATPRTYRFRIDHLDKAARVRCRANTAPF